MKRCTPPGRCGGCGRIVFRWTRRPAFWMRPFVPQWGQHPALALRGRRRSGTDLRVRRAVSTGPRFGIREVQDGFGTDGGPGSGYGSRRSCRNHAPNERLGGLPSRPLRGNPLLLFVFAIDDLGGANIYPAIWSALLAARAEGVGGVMTMVLRNFKVRVNDLLG